MSCPPQLKTITPTEFSESARFWAKETERGPVLIEAGSGDPLVVITLSEYHRLLDLDRKAFLTRDLPADAAQAILEANPSAEAEQFNDELGQAERRRT